MANTIYATPSTQLGMGLEAVRNTAAATFLWEKVKGPKYKPNLTLLADDTLQGSMVKTYNLVPGLRYDGHGWDGYLYGDTFAALVCALLGSTDTLKTAPSNTTLTADALAGATTIQTAGSIAVGSWITINSGAGTVETHKTTTLAGTTSPFTIGLKYPLHYKQTMANAVVTGLTGHTFSLLNNAGSTGNQPLSMTLMDFDGEEWRQITGAQLDKLNIKAASNALCGYTTNFLGNPAVTPSTPTPSFTTVDPVPSWAADLAIGGTKVTYVVENEFDLGRGTQAVPALTGTTGYYQYFAGPLDAPGKMTIIEQNGSPQLTQFLTYTQQSLNWTTFNVRNGYAVEVNSTLSEFKTGEIDRGKNWIEVPLEFQLLPNATDALAGGASPLTITIANATTTAYAGS